MPSMAELFAKDPLKLTDDELDEIVANMRTMRKSRNEKRPAAKKPNRKLTAQTAAAKTAADALGDVELDL